MVRRGWPLVLLLSWGCSGDGSGGRQCVGRARGAIHGGVEAPAQPRLEGGQLLAIGALEGPRGAVVCSATLIAPGRLLTAKHCAQAHRFRTGDVGAEHRFDVEARFEHPTRDLAVLTVDASLLSDLDVRPIPPWDGPVDASWIGRELTLAGLGLDEEMQSGRRLFSTEPVTRIEPDRIEVDGEGERGACSGDSGGPLLGADDAGAARVLGALSAGDPSCLGRDIYERVDTQRSWLEGALGAAAERCPEP